MTPEPPNPWGSCFDATAHNLLANRDAENLVVCHGVGTANRPGQEGMKIAHAWLEADIGKERVALDCVWLVFQSAALYRKNLQAEYVVEYAPEEFMRLWTEHDFPGPWDPTIRLFTADAHERPHLLSTQPE